MTTRAELRSSSPREASAPALPEDAALVARWDRALQDNASAILDAAAAFRERCRANDLTVLDDPGLALRPLFLSRATLEHLSEALHRAMLELRDQLLPLAHDPAALAERVPLTEELIAALDVRGALLDGDFGLVLRPDGVLADDGFVMTEPNFGNGYLISCAYPELVCSFLSSLPPFAALADAGGEMVNPLESVLAMIESRLPRAADGDERGRFVAILAHHEEHAIILGWEERVIQLVRHVQRRLKERGIGSAIVHEDELDIDDDGQTRTSAGQRVDLVFQLPIGTCFGFAPERFARELAHLRGTHVGNARLLQPLAHLLVDKGAMPVIQELPTFQARAPDDERPCVRCAYSEYPLAENVAGYRRHKDRLVLKRSFDGKHTFVGVSTNGRAWNRMLDVAAGTHDYVLQEYVPLPRTRVPAIVGGALEWIDVRVELSLLVIGGRYAGAFARYAPDEAGLVLSPPPRHMGFTVVWAT